MHGLNNCYTFVTTISSLFIDTNNLKFFTMKKSKGLTILVNGSEVSFHKLVIDTNKKWKENIGIFALERFLKKEGKKKTSELYAIFVHFGVNADNLNIDVIKAIFADNRLITSKGKEKVTFSAYSWIKDLREYCENNSLADLVKAEKDIIHMQIEERLTSLKNAA